jgi:cation transport ATPase
MPFACRITKRTLNGFLLSKIKKHISKEIVIFAREMRVVERFYGVFVIVIVSVLLIFIWFLVGLLWKAIRDEVDNSVNWVLIGVLRLRLGFYWH